MKNFYHKVFLLILCLSYFTASAQTVNDSVFINKAVKAAVINFQNDQQVAATVSTPVPTPLLNKNKALTPEDSAFGTALGKRSIPNKDWQKGGIFENGKPEDEILEKRTEFSKKFKMDSNKVRVIIAGPLHYKAANDAWEDINLKIVSSNDIKYNYINETNKFVSKFGKDINDGVKVTYKSNVALFGINPCISYNEGKPLFQFHNPEVTVNENKLSYNNFYNNVKLEYEVTSAALYQRWIFDTVNVFKGISKSENLSVTETMHLPLGAVLYDSLGLINDSREVKGVIYVVIGNDTISSLLPARIWDSKFTGDPINSIYSGTDENSTSIFSPITKISWKSDGMIDITVVVPVGWLVSPDRKYPVTLDPTYYVEIFHWGTNNYEYPWNTCCNSRTSQIYLLSGDIGYSGTISGVAFGHNINNGMSNGSATIGLKSTSGIQFGGPTLQGGFTNVFGPSTLNYTSGGGGYWRMINTSSFTYNTSSNLMVQAYFNNASHNGLPYTSGGTWFWRSSPYTSHCWAWNGCSYSGSGGTPAYGWNTPNVELIITVAPACTNASTPSSLSGFGSGTTTANITWNASSGTATITYYWAVKTYPGGTVHASGSTTNAYVSTVTGLNCGTNYYFTVYASNCSGWTSSTATMGGYFSTSSCCSSPSNEACSGTSIGSLPYSYSGNLGCTNDCSGQPYNDVFFRYNCTSTGSYTVDMCGSSGDTYLKVYSGSCCGSSIGSSDDVCSDDPSLTVSMNSGTTYYIECGDYSSGASPNESYSFHMERACDLATTPNGLWSNVTGQTTSSLYWNSSSGTSTIYYYWEVQTSGGSYVDDGYAGSGTSANVNGLSCGTQYRFKVQAYNCSTYSSWSSYSYFTTSSCCVVAGTPSTPSPSSST
ncbi:MAG: fibronectin type III domain-containing protein, partial [Bacteroidetes bacterium]|nr:fibronectin type III domain-containing protein [Bacteroidota bacterium]